MVFLFQGIFILFALFAVSLVVKRFTEGTLGKRGALFWILFWIGAIVAVGFPSTTSLLATELGIGRGVDLVTYIAIATLFFILFRLHIKIETIGRDITKVVRKDALDKARKQ